MNYVLSNLIDVLVFSIPIIVAIGLDELNNYIKVTIYNIIPEL